MATVTGYTAERMQEIEDQAITGGFVAAGVLKLVRNNGDQVTAGSVIGPQGPQGATGQVSNATLATEVATLNGKISDAGLGPVAMAQVSTLQTIATAGVWTPIAGAQVSFTPVVGRLYRIAFHASFMSLQDQSMVIGATADSGASYLAKASGFMYSNNWLTEMYGERLYLAPSGWNVLKTIRLDAYSTYAGANITANQGGSETRLYVEDCGIL